MIRDAHLIFSDAQALSTVGTDTISTNYLDALAKGDAIKPGARLKVVVDTAFTSSTSGGQHIVIALECHPDDPGFPSDNVVIFSQKVPKEAATAGAVIVDTVIPPGLLRYSRLTYKASENATGGKLNAYIVLDTDINVDRAL